MNKDYLAPGITAIALAVLYPIYWLTEIGTSLDMGAMRTEIGLLDVLFFVVCAMVAYIYFALKQLLNDHYEYRGADTLLMTLVVLNLVFYTTIFLLAVFESSEFVFGAVFVGGTFAIGALDLLLGVNLLRTDAGLNNRLRTFAAFIVVLGVIEVTVILSIAAIIVYPICVLILASAFLKDPEELQIV